MMLCSAVAFVEGYDPTINLSQKQLINMVHQIQPNEDGERAVDYTIYGQNYIMPKLKNTVLDLFEDK